jgi:CheY-like chemotaxis protein
VPRPVSSPPLHFLLADDNADGRYILSKTLLRRFPSAKITEATESADVITTARSRPVDAALLHRTADLDGLSLVQMLRAAAPELLILYLSGNYKFGAAARSI